MQHPAFEEVTVHHEHTDDATFRKKVWKTTWILSGLTIVELLLGFGLAKSWFGENPGLILFIKGVICILTLAKAFYIVSVFMHLGDEIRNFIMTIVVPLLLFVWFIAAFLWDGNSYKNLRNKFDPHFKESTMPAKKGAHDDKTHEVKPTPPTGKD